jgi:hypothetical protein
MGADGTPNFNSLLGPWAPAWMDIALRKGHTGKVQRARYGHKTDWENGFVFERIF